MIEKKMSPEELLFHDLEGNKTVFQDVVDEGLDGGYEGRIPGLIELLDSTEPYYRLLSCVMLTSWGEAAGFEKLIEWGNSPESAPWIAEPPVKERFTGADRAFEMLADGLRTSYYCEDSEELSRRQLGAAKTLLAIYHRYHFGQILALAIVKSKEGALELVDEIRAAMEASLERLEGGEQPGFELAFQTASLLMPLVDLDDKNAALYASRLISVAPDNIRMLRELIDALADGKGEDSLNILKRVEEMKISTVAEELKAAMERRAW